MMTGFRSVRSATALFFLLLLAAVAFASARPPFGPAPAHALPISDAPDCKKDQLPGERKKHGKLKWVCVTVPKEIKGTLKLEAHYKAEPFCASDYADYKNVRTTVLMKRGPLTHDQETGEEPVAYKLLRGASGIMGWTYDSRRNTCGAVSLHGVLTEGRAYNELNSLSNLQYTARDGSYGWAVGAIYEPQEFTVTPSNGTAPSQVTDWDYAPSMGGAGDSYSALRITRQVIEIGRDACLGCRAGSFEKTTWEFTGL